MKRKKALLAVLILTLAVILFFPQEEEVYPRPLHAKDTDGSSAEDILDSMSKGYETVILKHYPFGFVEVDKWESVRFPKKAFAIVEWKTYPDLGAGNIYIGYSFDGITYKEIGPFNESNYTQTALDIPVSVLTDLSSLRIRFRGEDLDFAVDAVAEVSIRLKVVRYKFGLIV